MKPVYDTIASVGNSHSSNTEKTKLNIYKKVSGIHIIKYEGDEYKKLTWLELIFPGCLVRLISEPSQARLKIFYDYNSKIKKYLEIKNLVRLSHKNPVLEATYAATFVKRDLSFKPLDRFE